MRIKREVDNMDNYVNFEAENCNDKSWNVIIKTLKDHLPNFDVSYGDGDYMTFRFGDVDVRTLLENYLEFNYLRAYPYCDLKKRVYIYKNETRFELNQEHYNCIVDDFNENEENHTVAIYIK